MSRDSAPASLLTRPRTTFHHRIPRGTAFAWPRAIPRSCTRAREQHYAAHVWPSATLQRTPSRAPKQNHVLVIMCAAHGSRIGRELHGITRISLMGRRRAGHFKDQGGNYKDMALVLVLECAFDAPKSMLPLAIEPSPGKVTFKVTLHCACNIPCEK